MSWRRGSGYCGPKVLQCFKQAACEAGPITQVQGGETAVRSRVTPIGESRANAGTLTGLTEPPNGETLPVEVDRRRGRANGRTPSTLSTICPLEAPGGSSRRHWPDLLGGAAVVDQDGVARLEVRVAGEHGQDHLGDILGGSGPAAGVHPREPALRLGL